jgi:hypothetical protein
MALLFGMTVVSQRALALDGVPALSAIGALLLLIRGPLVTEPVEHHPWWTPLTLVSAKPALVHQGDNCLAVLGFGDPCQRRRDDRDRSPTDPEGMRLVSRIPALAAFSM